MTTQTLSKEIEYHQLINGSSSWLTFSAFEFFSLTKFDSFSATLYKIH